MDMRRRHLSYLLRLWQAEQGEGIAWRASLESPHTGERHGFASLEALFAFLEAETAAPAWQEPHEGYPGAGNFHSSAEPNDTHRPHGGDAGLTRK